jgi:hypothetical protein
MNLFHTFAAHCIDIQIIAVALFVRNLITVDTVNWFTCKTVKVK